MRRRLTTRMALSIGSVAVVSVLAIALLAVANRELSAAAEVSRRADRTVDAANRLEALVIDVQTGARGYVITQRDEFLEPYRLARRLMPIESATLEGATAGDAQQSARARAAVEAADTYLKDFAQPLVVLARDDPAAARARVASGDGKRYVDQIRSAVGGIISAEHGTAAIQSRTDVANDRAARALALALVAVLFIVAMLAGVMAFLARSVAAPVRRAAHAAEQVAAGDLSVRLHERREDEIGHLSDAFNRMGDSLQANAVKLDDQRVELEAQNTALGEQASELEARADERAEAQAELQRVNASLKQQTEDLREASGLVLAAHRRDAIFADLAEGLGLRPALQGRADTLLASAVEATGAVIGAVYAVGEPDRALFRLVNRRGVAEGQLPEIATPGAGMAGRALREREPVRATRADGDLVVESFGKLVPLRHEVHVPLVHGSRVLGVLSLGRTAPESFTDEEVLTLEHLAEQASVSFENALETQRSRRLADLNSAVLDAAGDAIHLVGMDGETILTNPAMDRFCREVLGIPAPGPQPGGGDLIPAIAQRTADPERHLRRLEQISSDEDFEGSDEYELVDTHRWVHRYTAPVRATDGQLIGRIFVMRETTAQRQAERAKDDLMSTVSHELRTPLSAILGYTDLLLARDHEVEERQEYLGTIRDQTGRLANLISDFLDLQRFQDGAEHVKVRPVDLRPLLQEQVALFSHQSERHRLMVQAEPDDDLVGQGDPDALRRVVGNLLSNAIKYSPDGGEVVVQATRANGSVTVAVRDHGLGMAPEVREQVFRRFYRAGEAERRGIGGTGLGLALVREIIVAVGGEVGCDSVEGQGSLFWFTVPAERTLAAA